MHYVECSGSECPCVQDAGAGLLAARRAGGQARVQLAAAAAAARGLRRRHHRAPALRGPLRQAGERGGAASKQPHLCSIELFF